MPAAVFSLAFAAFAIGTTEFVIVGLLPDIGRAFGISVSTAGLLVSFYALAITIGTPLISAVTARLPRRALLLALMTFFTLCNLAAGLSDAFGALLAIRIAMAVAHGVFFGLGTTVAMSLVPAQKSGRAVAIMVSGLTVAMVTGVPGGTWLGDLMSWRLPFLVVAAMGAVATVGLWRLLPSLSSQRGSGSILSQLSLLRSSALMPLYAMAALGMGATFAVFTYLSALLTNVTGMTSEGVTLGLMIFGLGSVAGTIGGGRLADRYGPKISMNIALSGLALSVAALWGSAHQPVLVMINLFVWGAFAFAVPPIMQATVVLVAQRVAPQAVGTAAGLNVAAFNLGISGGSFVGGLALAGGSVVTTVYVGVALALVGLAVVATYRWSGRRSVRITRSTVAECGT
ncbi:MFS transporter [Paraburkholderia phenoliruptrix]|uniref:MFS transporter n=1 Tax=Paraburkholderia phenoliruptrix TaxID=252970 RepID=UPI001C6EAD52|nr:MFS transporter [Paraburkholderia phenoliruptrix]MBW9103994.1 MFS transporter [Paraburkholderia phenoliruptrix]MBW9131110.1 MFS transporter [Paraburkholderia ginsengiterrae]